MVQNVYTDCFTTEIGCRMYLDASGQTAAPAGEYSDGTNCYSVDSDGFVTAVNLCGETTTTTSTTSTTSTSTTSTTSTSTSTTSTSTSTSTTTAAPGPFVYNAQVNCPNDRPTGIWRIETSTPFNFNQFNAVSSLLYQSGSDLFTGTRCFLIFNNHTGSGFNSPVTASNTFYDSDYEVACAECLQYITPNYTSGSWNTGFQAVGTGSIVKKIAGIGVDGCKEPNWTDTTAQSITGSGINDYTVYINSIQLTSGSSYRPNVTVNGISVPGLVYWPLSSSYECGQSPLFVKHYYNLTGLTIDRIIYPNIPYLVDPGDKILYYKYNGTNPPDSAVIPPINSTRQEVSVSPAQPNMTHVTINVSSGNNNILYNTF